MNPRNREGGTAVQRFERRQHELTGRSEQYGPIQGVRRAVEAVAHPDRAELLGQLAVLAAAAET